MMMATTVEAETKSDFRAETRAWLEANCPPGARDLSQAPENSFWGGRHPVYPSADQKLWFERMAARGWTVPDWPVEYGGGGLDKTQSAILAQEVKRIKAASPLQSLGIWMLGPALLKFGTEEQKRKYLPEIAQGKIRWAQGYSEPGAGSDLASVQTRGEDKGDHFLINGSKIWTSSGDKCDMIFALIRTEPDAPKHLGISFLLIDMDQPGVTTHPIKLISGSAHFTATFFDDVITAKENIVGTRGRGWDVAKYLLGHERQMIGSSLSNSTVEPLDAMARRVLGEEGLKREAGLRQAIAQHLIETWTMDIAVERMRDMGQARQMSAFTPNVLKLLGTELNYRRSELAMSLGGVDHLVEGSPPAYNWLQAPPNCIAGGSNEVQLNIIAKRALELPEA
jgi:alkylation response protein AidB-like acyl-CoA dehydrogenase